MNLQDAFPVPKWLLKKLQLRAFTRNGENISPDAVRIRPGCIEITNHVGSLLQWHSWSIAFNLNSMQFIVSIFEELAHG